MATEHKHKKLVKLMIPPPPLCPLTTSLVNGRGRAGLELELELIFGDVIPRSWRRLVSSPQAGWATIAMVVHRDRSWSVENCRQWAVDKVLERRHATPCSTTGEGQRRRQTAK